MYNDYNIPCVDDIQLFSCCVLVKNDGAMYFVTRAIKFLYFFDFVCAIYRINMSRR